MEKGSTQEILTIVVIDAKDIKFNTLLGSPSPYAVVRVAREKYQTEICEKQEKPVWNSRFAIDLKKFSDTDELVIEVFDYNAFISDTKIASWKDQLRNITKIQKSVRYLELTSADKKNRSINGKIQVSFDYFTDAPVNFSSSTSVDPEGNPKQSHDPSLGPAINSATADGILRINILNGTQLLRSKDSTSGQVHLATLEQHTSKFKLGNPTINRKYFMNCTAFAVQSKFLAAGSKEVMLKYVLRNQFGSSGPDCEVGNVVFSLDSLTLFENKPKCLQQNFSDAGTQNAASMMCEYTFLRNGFTRFPKGQLRVKIDKVDNGTLKKAFYTLTSNSPDLNKFYREGPSYFIEVKSVLDQITFSLYADKDILEIAQNKEKFNQMEPDIVTILNLSELNWSECVGDDIERETHTTISFVKNKFATKVTLQLTHRNEDKWGKEKKDLDPLVASMKRQQTLHVAEKTPIQVPVDRIRNGGGGGSIANQLSGNMNTSMASTFSRASKDAMTNNPQKLTFDTLKELDHTNENSPANTPKHTHALNEATKNMFFRFKNIALNGLILDDLGKTNLFLEVSIASLNYRCFTPVCDNPYKFIWPTDIPIIYIDDSKNAETAVSFKLFDLYSNPNLGDGEAFASKFSEILSYIVPIKELEDIAIRDAQKNNFTLTEKTLVVPSKPIVHPSFQAYMKKILASKGKSMENFLDNVNDTSKLSISYTQNKSLVVDKPLGILTIESIVGENVQYQNLDLIDSVIVLELNGQVLRTSDSVNSKTNPSWNKRMKAFTNSPLDVLKIKLFDYSPSMSHVLFALDIFITDLPIFSADKPNLWKVPLSAVNPLIRGNFVFNFGYTPISQHPFYRMLENAADLNEKAYWVERYEDRTLVAEQGKATQIKSTCVLTLAIRGFHLKPKPNETHVCFVLRTAGDSKKFVTPKYPITNSTFTFDGIAEKFRAEMHPHSIKEGTIEIECQILSTKDWKQFQISTILNGSFEWTKYPMKKFRNNFVSIGLKRIGARTIAAAEISSIEALTLSVEIFDSPAIERCSQCILNMKPLSVNNMNFSLAQNDIPFKTSLQYVLRITTTPKKGAGNTFAYALNTTTTSIKDQKNVVFIPETFSSQSYFATPMKAHSLQKIIVQDSTLAKDRQLSFDDRLCSLFASNGDSEQVITIELLQITDLSVKHPMNIDYNALDETSMLLLRGSFTFTDVFNLMTERETNTTFAVKLRKQNQPVNISQGECNLNPIGAKQEELVFLFAADFSSCQRSLANSSSQSNEMLLPFEYLTRPRVPVKEEKAGLIQVELAGVYGINSFEESGSGNSASGNLNANGGSSSNSGDSCIFSNQLILRQLDAESLSQLTAQQKSTKHVRNNLDTTSEYYKNDDCPLSENLFYIHHSGLSELPISLTKNIVDFLNFDRSKRFRKRKLLESFQLNYDALDWQNDQFLDVNMLMQNDMLVRGALLHLRLSFLRNRFTENPEGTLVLKSFELRDLKPKEWFDTSLYLNVYVQSSEDVDQINQRHIALSNGKFPAFKETDMKLFHQSTQQLQSFTRVLHANEFKPTDSSVYTYAQAIALRCSSIFDVLVIDLCDTKPVDAATAGKVLSKVRIPLNSIDLPFDPTAATSHPSGTKLATVATKNSISLNNTVNGEDTDSDDEDQYQQQQRNNGRSEKKIRTLVESGTRRITLSKQGDLELHFFIVLYNSVQMIKRVPAKLTLEYTLKPPQQGLASPYSLSFVTIARLKAKLSQARERLYRIYYYDSKMNAKFKGMNLEYVRGAFKKMSKNYNYPLFKKYLNPNAIQDGQQSDLCVWQFTIPSGATFSIKGSLKGKYSFNIILSIVHPEKSRPPTQNSAHFKKDSYSIVEERGSDGDQIKLTEIRFNKEIDFYVSARDVTESSKINIQLKFLDKEGKLKTEEGEIPSATIQKLTSSITSAEDLYEPNPILLFFRPSNFRLNIISRVIASEFAKSHTGEVSVAIHKIVHIDPTIMLDSQGLKQSIRAQNKILLSKFHGAQKKASVFALSAMKLKVSVNGQKEFTAPIDYEGCLIQNQFKRMNFLTSHFNDRIDLKLVLTSESASSMVANLLDTEPTTVNLTEPDEETNANAEGEDIVSVSAASEIVQENNDEYLKSDRSINICKGSFYLIDSIVQKPQEDEFYFLQPLSEMLYHENDVMKSFFNFINRKNLYVLGSYTFKPLHWAKVFMKIDGIKNIQFNPEHAISESMINLIENNTNKDALVYFNVRIRTVLYFQDFSTQIVQEQATRFIEARLEALVAQIQSNSPFDFKFNPSENYSVIYRHNPNVENIVIEVKLVMLFDGSEIEISSRIYPVKKMCEQKYLNHVMSLDLELNELSSSPDATEITLLVPSTFPTLSTRIQSKQEVKRKKRENEFDKRIHENKGTPQKGEQKDSTMKLNFRNTTLGQLLYKLLTAQNRQLILLVLNEIHELLLYLEYEKYREYFKIGLLCLISMLRVYYDDSNVSEQVLMTMCSLCSQDIDQYIVVFTECKGLATLEEVAVYMNNIKLIPSEKLSSVSHQTLSTLEHFVDTPTNITCPPIGELQSNLPDPETLFAILVSNRNKALKGSVRSQNDFDLLEYNEKEEFLLNKSRRSLSIMKLLEFFSGNDITRVLSILPILPIVNELFVSCAGSVQNFVPMYTMIVTKVLGLTISVEHEEQLGLQVFIEFINTIANAIDTLKPDERVSAIALACKVFDYICYKQDMDAIRATAPNYFMALFSIIIHFTTLTRKKLNEILESIVNQIPVISSDPKALMKQEFQTMADDKRLVKNLQRVIEDEIALGNAESQQENDDKQNELFNQDVIIENCFKILTILSRDFIVSQVEVESLESMLKQKQKSVKKPKRKALIENFLNFLFSKAQGLQNLNKYDITRRKEQLLQAKKKDQFADILKTKNDLATKYLISRLDWK